MKKLIRPDDLRESWIYSPNIEIHTVDQAIERAQKIDLSDFLGRALYAQLVDNITTDENFHDLFYGKKYKLTGDEIYFDGLLPLLCIYARMRLIDIVEVYLSRSGMTIESNDGSEIVDGEKLSIKKRIVLTDRTFHEKQAIDYLNTYNSTFKKWHPKKLGTSFDFMVITSNE
jgi:hypothetical protein